ncbi:MAG: tRNA (adenosine(37)-N6)-threonylcarbamoyltransferase complex ATPase subunit type 1 TsaE [Bacteroidales bacterium]|jgi:tRNA threonylcarbamoyladenosine biosynthesis protein TsaE|nr:tRNA (adenosine(37)-N6)-threonylcarbamoyltransferase complex ATPase subunit type 1 TsaE [Bacteroidales bacterium]
MSVKEITVDNLHDIRRGAEEFLEYVSSPQIDSNVFAFYGSMGAGKTTFIKALCEVLGVKDVVNSPTFTIINEYQSSKGFPVYHFDFYRINSIKEAYDIAIEEYFSGDGLCFMEWPEKIESILPENTVKVYITVKPDGGRVISIR